MDIGDGANGASEFGAAVELWQFANCAQRSQSADGSSGWLLQWGAQPLALRRQTAMQVAEDLAAAAAAAAAGDGADCPSGELTAAIAPAGGRSIRSLLALGAVDVVIAKFCKKLNTTFREI